MGGGGPSVKVVSKADQAAAKEAGGVYKSGDKDISKKDAAKEQTDYCIYAAMGYEMISTFIQQDLQSKIETSLKDEKDMQLKALLALKKTHEARRKTSIYQGTVYTTTGACYIARAALSQGRVVMDWKYWAKMGAAAGLATLYYMKAKKHKEAAKKVQEVIEKLPGLGECNPWTKTACFCAEKTSKTSYADTYQEVCELNKGETDPNQVAVGCGVMKDGAMTYDKECKCKSSNTCFKPKLTSTNMKFALGSNLMNQANKGFDLLGNGDFDSGKFDSYSMQSGANAAKLKDKMSVSNMPKLNLNEKEKSIADSFKGLLPAEVAAMAAKSPSVTPPGGFGDAGLNAALDKVPKNLKDKVSDTEPVKYSSGGPGFGSTAEGAEESIAMPGGEGANQSGTEVLTFAEKALENADVTNSPDTPIFDIISNRYIRSGLNKLQVEEKK
jgi:hypothetical protein